MHAGSLHSAAVTVINTEMLTLEDHLCQMRGALA